MDQEVGQISEETDIAVENEHRLGPDSLALWDVLNLSMESDQIIEEQKSY